MKIQGPFPRLPQRWVKDNGQPEQAFFEYMVRLDALAQLLNGGALANLVNAANDAAAAIAGVSVGQIYRNGSVLQIRVA